MKPIKKMSSAQLEKTAFRIAELLGQGKTITEVVPLIAREGYRDGNGLELTRQRVFTILNGWKKNGRCLLPEQIGVSPGVKGPTRSYSNRKPRQKGFKRTSGIPDDAPETISLRVGTPVRLPRGGLPPGRVQYRGAPTRLSPWVLGLAISVIAWLIVVSIFLAVRGHP